MVSFLKLVIWLMLLALLIWFGATVKLGKLTLFAHIQRIWKSDETQDLVQGAEDKAAPVIEGIGQAARRAMSDPVVNPPPPGGPDAGPVTPDAGAPLPPPVAKPRPKRHSKSVPSTFTSPARRHTE
jgi:hypothetical protein